MSKAALLIGINYVTVPEATLGGCIDDVVNMKNLLVQHMGYAEENIVTLRDDVLDALPTRANIVAALQQIMTRSATCSEIWIHYSGHGTQLQDPRAVVTFDSVLVPLDYESSGFISDHELYAMFQYAKCPTFAIMDCCHSGNICELQYTTEYISPGVFRSLKTGRPPIVNQQIVVFSGCKESQTAEDVFDQGDKQREGLFTDTFLHTLADMNHTCSILDLYQRICMTLADGGHTQTPLLSSSGTPLSWQFGTAGTARDRTSVTITLPTVATTLNMRSMPLRVRRPMNHRFTMF